MRIENTKVTTELARLDGLPLETLWFVVPNS